MERGGCIYIMSNFKRTVLYVGVTSDFSTIEEAIAREKEIKGWKRFKKDNLIKTANSELKDLFDDIREW